MLPSKIERICNNISQVNSVSHVLGGTNCLLIASEKLQHGKNHDQSASFEFQNGP